MFSKKYHFLFTIFLFFLSVNLYSTDYKNDTYSLVTEEQRSPCFKNMGTYSFPITTKSMRAHLFFDQGLKLAYSFNHREAFRSFQEAIRLDPNCAMCYWGAALALGPNVNTRMDKENVQLAWSYLQKAMRFRNQATDKEKAIIEALESRYSQNPNASRQKLNQEYALAMKYVYEKFPCDDDVATLYAEALMNTRPWDYWRPDGTPYPETIEIVNALEKTLTRNPNHPGALHFYIHAMEASNHPEKAERAADKLACLNIEAGQMIHMPSHIYMKVARYDDAIEQNKKAVKVDENYLTQCKVEGFQPLTYYPLNKHFLTWAYIVQGRKKDALEISQKTVENLSPEQIAQIPYIHSFLILPLIAQVKFEQWEDILAEPMPLRDQPFKAAIWHFAKGMAYAGQKQFPDAQCELSQLRNFQKNCQLRKLRLLSKNTAGQILDIAVEILEGRIAAADCKWDQAIAHYHRAVLLEDHLIAHEPPDWLLPARHYLGGTLIKLERYPEAEIVYWQDLERQKNNGWALNGLLTTLRAQRKKELAKNIQQRLDCMWKNADIPLANLLLPGFN